MWLNILSVIFLDLDLTLSPTGKVVRTVGESLPVIVEKMASGDVQVFWTKVRDCAG